MWQEDQQWEASWWGDCCNTYGEETKQLHYAKRMGLLQQNDSQGPFFDMQGKSVLDVGCGPVSMLLKCRNVRGAAIDPCKYPDWTIQRYKCAGIEFHQMRGEDLFLTGFDEVWLYNVLQHTEQPDIIVRNCLSAGKIVRVFDWLEIGVAPGHPQNLTKEKMDEWFCGYGKAERGNGGLEYFGVFKGNGYE